MELTVGAILEGKVKSITNFGAFISLPEGKTGMVHISEVANAYVSDIRQHLTEGQDVKVMVIGLENGKVNLSIKRLEPKPQRENGGNRNGNYRGAPRQDGGYRRENSAVRSMSASIAGAIVRRSSAASPDDAANCSPKLLTAALQPSHRAFMRALSSPPSLSFTGARRGNAMLTPRAASQPSSAFAVSASSW